MLLGSKRSCWPPAIVEDIEIEEKDESNSDGSISLIRFSSLIVRVGGGFNFSRREKGSMTTNLHGSLEQYGRGGSWSFGRGRGRGSWSTPRDTTSTSGSACVIWAFP